MFDKFNTLISDVKRRIRYDRITPSVQKLNTFLKNISDKTLAIFDRIAKQLAKKGVSANIISILGFVIGLFAINFLAMEQYGLALIFILLNRAFDVIDGAVARHSHSKGTDFGVFLDASLDYIFYAGVIFGFALANPAHALVAAFLLFAFSASASTMLAYAVIAYKSNSKDKLEFSQSPFYLGGLAQGFETLIALIMLCLLPWLFLPIASLLGVLCLFKTFSIIVTAYYNFAITAKPKNTSKK